VDTGHREDLVTVADAATLMHVNRSTIRRWIAQGTLPAYRLGTRRVALKRADLAQLITLIGHQAGAATNAIPKLTPAEQRRALAAMDAAARLREEIAAGRGGQPFAPDSWELLNESRDQRSRDLA